MFYLQSLRSQNSTVEAGRHFIILSARGLSLLTSKTESVLIENRITRMELARLGKRKPGEGERFTR